MIKKELRYIRYRICRTIYYADQCPTDNRKNYVNLAKSLVGAIGIGVFCFAMLFVFVLMA